MESTTQIKERDFNLSLPGVWRAERHTTPSLWQYSSAKKNEQISVSIATSKSPITQNERPDVLAKFQEARFAAEQKQAPSATLSKPSRSAQQNAWVGFYSGYDPSRSRRFGDFTIVNDRVIANFYYEALDMSQADFDARLQRVIGSVGLAK